MLRTHSNRSRLLTVTCFVATISSNAVAQCAHPSRNYPGNPWAGGAIGLVGGPGVGATELRDAVAIWQRCCASAFLEQALPELWVNQPGHRTIHVEYIPSTSPRLGVCGTFSGDTISIWRFAMRADGRFACVPRSHIIAHEIGHILGLADAPGTRACANHIMAPLVAGSQWQSHVDPAECALASNTNAPTRYVAALSSALLPGAK